LQTPAAKAAVASKKPSSVTETKESKQVILHKHVHA
jgi:hypothetical protein